MALQRRGLLRAVLQETRRLSNWPHWSARSPLSPPPPRQQRRQIQGETQFATVHRSLHRAESATVTSMSSCFSPQPCAERRPNAHEAWRLSSLMPRNSARMRAISAGTITASISSASSGAIVGCGWTGLITVHFGCPRDRRRCTVQAARRNSRSSQGTSSSPVNRSDPAGSSGVTERDEDDEPQ